MDGKIDMILTKSVSRFARNTVDSLLTIRKLKEKNIEEHQIKTVTGLDKWQATVIDKMLRNEKTWGTPCCRKHTP